MFYSILFYSFFLTLWYGNYFLLLTVLHFNGQVEQKLTTDDLDPQVIETYMTQLCHTLYVSNDISFCYCIIVISNKQLLLKEI